MNGKYLLDTNAVVGLLRGNTSLIQILQKATWVGISVITELAFLSFPELVTQDELLFQQFKSRVEVVDLQSSDMKMISRIIEIRRSAKVKLPDAIIAATALENDATLVSQDMGFSRVDMLSVQGFS
jgi:predicted nucleic acid-binding protein